jgi:hypothetical protein
MARFPAGSSEIVPAHRSKLMESKPGDRPAILHDLFNLSDGREKAGSARALPLNAKPIRSLHRAMNSQVKHGAQFFVRADI